MIASIFSKINCYLKLRGDGIDIPTRRIRQTEPLRTDYGILHPAGKACGSGWSRYRPCTGRETTRVESLPALSSSFRFRFRFSVQCSVFSAQYHGRKIPWQTGTLPPTRTVSIGPARLGCRSRPIKRVGIRGSFRAEKALPKTRWNRKTPLVQSLFKGVFSGSIHLIGSTRVRMNSSLMKPTRVAAAQTAGFMQYKGAEKCMEYLASEAPAPFSTSNQ